MPKRPCLEAGCGSFATFRGRCKTHAKFNDKSIARAGRAIYQTKRWALLRRHKLFLDPICQAEECHAIATDVHHKHGVQSDPWAIEGLESLCHSHHSKLTRQGQLAG